MLSIDITQINYTLYGAVRRLMEKGEEMDRRMERMERIGGVSEGGVDGDGVVVSEGGEVVSEDSMSSNVVVSEDSMNSNVVVSEDSMNSNVVVINNSDT
jgi:hypothetical protein